MSAGERPDTGEASARPHDPAAAAPTPRRPAAPPRPATLRERVAARLRGVTLRERIARLLAPATARERITAPPGSATRERITALLGPATTRERISALLGSATTRERITALRGSATTRERTTAPPSPATTREAVPGLPGSATTRERFRGLPGSASARERIAALLALGSAVGVVLFVFASLGSSGSRAPGLADLDVTSARRVVAPGGWVALRGSGAPERTRLVLETRSQDGPWRAAGSALANDEGDFRLNGRALARPGPLDVRARAPGAGASTPVAITVRPLRLASVGDINLGDAPGDAIAANGPRYPWGGVSAPLRKADIAFGNLECAISERGVPFPKEFNFRGTPDALAGLRRHSGIDVLNLANNHVGDYGREAMLDTVRHVEGLGMRAVGAGRNLRRALAPQVVERLGLRVAFVGFSQIAPIEFAAAERTPGTAWATPESVTQAVRAARRRADVVVATFHWGIEKAPFESAEQQALAQTAAAAGAHLVIGAHPHVLQPMRREGAALVAYSLGNFVFGAASSDTTTTGILETGLTADGVSRARWRPGRIVGARPVLDAARPRRLPVNDPEAMAAGVSL
jgi:poly-gamma-glutamate synthesis protein (capsule biosynthesis protein)